MKHLYIILLILPLLFLFSGCDYMTKERTETETRDLTTPTDDPDVYN